MFSKDELKRYADVLIWGLATSRENPFQKGDVILVRFDNEAAPLAEIIHARILEQGWHPVLRWSPNPVMEKDFYTLSDEEQLTFIAPGQKELFSSLHGAITLLAPDSLTHLSSVEPKRIGKSLVARKSLREIWEKREQQGKFGWTLCLYPTVELAQQAGISLEEYKKQVVRACYLDKMHPVDHWKDIYKQATRIKDWLNSLLITDLRIESDNMDLRVRLGEQRRWIGISGHNIPSFEIFTSPDWRGTEGVYFADQPSFRNGNVVEKVELVFENGHVTKSSAAKGEGFIKGQLEMDEGASRIGEFSLTDRRFSRINSFMAHTLYDENFGGDFGNCHVAVGASYGETFSGDKQSFDENKKNELGFNDSALHWDLVNTEEKRVTATLASGKKQVIYEHGEFKRD